MKSIANHCTFQTLPVTLTIGLQAVHDSSLFMGLKPIYGSYGSTDKFQIPADPKVATPKFMIQELTLTSDKGFKLPELGRKVQLT